MDASETFADTPQYPRLHTPVSPLPSIFFLFLFIATYVQTSAQLLSAHKVNTCRHNPVKKQSMTSPPEGSLLPPPPRTLSQLLSPRSLCLLELCMNGSNIALSARTCETCVVAAAIMYSGSQRVSSVLRAEFGHLLHQHCLRPLPPAMVSASLQPSMSKWFCPHFTDEETEALRGPQFARVSQTVKVGPAHLGPELCSVSQMPGSPCQH